MKYVKHPTFGNRHVSDEEAPALVAEGWVIWPRTKEQKEGLAAPQATAPVADLLVKPEPAGAAPSVDELRAELDRRGIKYHHKAGAAKLQALLA